MIDEDLQPVFTSSAGASVPLPPGSNVARPDARTRLGQAASKLTSSSVTSDPMETTGFAGFGMSSMGLLYGIIWGLYGMIPYIYIYMYIYIYIIMMGIIIWIDTCHNG